MERRAPGQRAGLTRESVLEAAHALLGEHGIEGVTMRALAARLGVAPNAIYSHVRDKTALVDAVLDDVLQTVERPNPARVDPGRGLRDVMVSTYHVLLDHPDLVPLYIARRGSRGPNARALGEAMLALFERGGVKGAPAREALRVLLVYTMGFAAFATGDSSTADLPAPAGVSPAALSATFEGGLHALLRGIGVPR
jgi:TetR/AcrR family tetracycline transcriptional repressor